ncbi:MAG: hypothetical protein QW764_02895 [Desulfurococcaceae archaeon]
MTEIKTQIQTDVNGAETAPAFRTEIEELKAPERKIAETSCSGITAIRLEIALSLLQSNAPEAKRTLKALAQTDRVVAAVLKTYGVEIDE